MRRDWLWGKRSFQRGAAAQRYIIPYAPSKMQQIKRARPHRLSKQACELPTTYRASGLRPLQKACPFCLVNSIGPVGKRIQIVTKIWVSI